MRKYLLAFGIFLLLQSCECPPGADTPKVIRPTQFAKVNFFNAIYRSNAFEVQTYFGYLLNNLYFGYSSGYLDVGSGSNVITLLSEGERFFSFPLNLKQNRHYTLSVSGYNSSNISTFLIEDSLDNLDKSKSYFRVINAFEFNAPIKVHLSTESDTVAVAYHNYSQFQEVTSSGHIEVFFDSKRIYNLVFDPTPGVCYSLISYYSPAPSLNEQGIAVDLIEFSL